MKKETNISRILKELLVEEESQVPKPLKYRVKSGMIWEVRIKG